MEACWGLWSTLLGLKENNSKAQYFHHSLKGRRNFLDLHVSPDGVTDKPCVLGWHMQGFVTRTCNDKEKAKLQDAAACVRKASRLPSAKDKNQCLAAYAALSKAKHRWYQKLPAQANFRIVEGAVDRLCEELRNTSPYLRRLFRSHRIDVLSRVLQNLVDTAVRYMKNTGAQCPSAWSHYHGSSASIKRLLLQQGWINVQPWKWRHPHSNATISLDARDRPNPERTRHNIREGLRAHLFVKWRGTGRNDAMICAAVPY